MVTIEKFQNGLVVIVEEMPHVESVAYELDIRGGIISDHSELEGLSLIMAELTSRGANNLNSRQISESFDSKGIRHGEFADYDRYVYRGSAIAENLEHALGLVSSMVQKPSLPESEISNIRDLLIQDIDSLIDNPARRAGVELTKRYFPAPYNRSSLGTKEGLLAVKPKFIKDAWNSAFRPSGSILSIAGNVKTEKVLSLIKKHFGSWEGSSPELPKFGEMSRHQYAHIPFESAQHQIVLCYPSAKFGDEDYYIAKVATGILSGGMFGRLFIEVREKRGLCYSVYARHSANEHVGTNLLYAGTTPERAQETLDVMVDVLRGLPGTVQDDELQRAKANISTQLVLGEESSASRAGSNASDYRLINRVRTLEEVQSGIQSVTGKYIDRYIKRFPSDSFMLVTLGSRELTPPVKLEKAV